MMNECVVKNHVTLKSSPVKILGSFPRRGDIAPGFTLVSSELKDITLSSIGKVRKIIYIFPSIETSVCATSVRKLSEIADKNNTVLLCISADLPFTHSRFFSEKGMANLIALSTMRRNSFSQDYGVQIIDGPLEGITTRAVLVLDAENTVLYSDRVSEITNEPNYDELVAHLQ
jgi:thiol peroxidase